jgi:hypothetical protein
MPHIEATPHAHILEPSVSGLDYIESMEDIEWKGKGAMMLFRSLFGLNFVQDHVGFFFL